MEVSKVVKRWIFNVVLKSSLTFNIRLTNLLTITLHILSSKDTLQLTFTQKNETLKNKTVNVLQEAVKTVHTSLLLPTTSWRHYYLHTGKVSFEWNPGLNIVHQVIHDLEIFTLFFPHLMMKIKCLSLIFIVCNIRDSSALTVNALSSWVLLVVIIESQCNSIRCSSWIGLSIMLFVFWLIW